MSKIYDELHCSGYATGTKVERLPDHLSLSTSPVPPRSDFLDQARNMKDANIAVQCSKTYSTDIDHLNDVRFSKSQVIRLKRNLSSHNHRYKDPSDSPSPVKSNGHSFPIFGVLPSFLKVSLKLALGTTVALYILNQKHLLPRPLSAVVSRYLFWPTLPITMSRRIGRWITEIDDTVVMGGAPIGLLKYPERLNNEYGVKGVINLCEEYRGPIEKYKELGIDELYIPTTDHFEPSVDDMIKAVKFIERFRKGRKGKVYVHCRAGHGRSAAVAFVWLMTRLKNPEEVDMQGLNAYLCSLRDVRSTLWNQPNINEFREWIVLTE